MDQIVGLMILAVLVAMVRGTGRKILGAFGRADPSKEAADVAGVGFWFVIAVSIFYLVRYLLSDAA